MWPLLALARRHPWAANVAAYGTLFSAADVAQQVLAGPHWDLSEPEYLDLKQTGKVALVGFTFHANFNYIWFRSLERLLPGANAARVIVKVACDQTIAAPITIGAFYTGWSPLLDFIAAGELRFLAPVTTWLLRKSKFEQPGRDKQGPGIPGMGRISGGPWQVPGRADMSDPYKIKVLNQPFARPKEAPHSKTVSISELLLAFASFIPSLSFSQAVNFTLVPPVLRTAYVGACSFLWTSFLCYLRRNDAQDTTAQIFRGLPGLAGFFPSVANEREVILPSEK